MSPTISRVPTGSRHAAQLRTLGADYAKSRSNFAMKLAHYFEAASGLSQWRGVGVLDVGCGNGAISRTFAELGASVTGIEYDRARIERIATSALNFHLVAGDGQFLPFRPGAFDFVVVADVLEHVSDPRRMLQEIARVTRSGGLVYVGATNRASIVNLLFDPHYNLPLIPLMSKRQAAWYVTRFARVSDSYTVEKYFVKGEILRLLESSGFACRLLPVYEEKLKTLSFATTRGWPLAKTLLGKPAVRRLAVWFSKTATFGYFVGGAFHYLCKRLPDNVNEGYGV
jgi:2-polyprenyl-3-methyl-5-hydroxy-6-metoxy-1,4-benzoquinol methylase